MSVFRRRRSGHDIATAGRAMLSAVKLRNPVPAPRIRRMGRGVFVVARRGRLELAHDREVAQAGRSAQQTLMAAGHDIWVAGILHEMPAPLGWIESQDQRVVISLFGLRVAPCMQQRLSGLGPLVALSVARYRESGSRAFISVGDVERVFSIDGRGAAALADRLFAELPFLGSQVPAEIDRSRRRSRNTRGHRTIRGHSDDRRVFEDPGGRDPRPSAIRLGQMGTGTGSGIARGDGRSCWRLFHKPPVCPAVKNFWHGSELHRM